MNWRTDKEKRLTLRLQTLPALFYAWKHVNTSAREGHLHTYKFRASLILGERDNFLFVERVTLAGVDLTLQELLDWGLDSR